MALTPENITGLMIRSKLLSPEQVRSIYDRWQKEGKKNVKSTPHYLKWIVSNAFLTEYQAALLAHGCTDGFFLGQYKILDRLGKGRMAGVYKAVHRLGQIVAIKVLPPSKAKDKRLLARFQREAQLAMKLKHPNVVRTFEVGRHGDLHYIVMEYLEGETLEEVLARRKKLPYKEAVRLGYQTLQGLQHLHEKGLVHRDLKPGNLMLVPAHKPGQPDNTLNATVKILDIGFGREIFDANEGQADVSSLELTREGMILGTPDYLAPEQARDPSNIDIRADIYSLGCILYHCLTGQPPFPDTNLLTQMVRHATEDPQPVSDFVSDVPDGLQQVLDWMMAKKPEQRYPTPERAAQALKVFMAAGAEVKQAEDAPQMRRYLTYLETQRGEQKEETPSGEPGDGGSPPPASQGAEPEPADVELIPVDPSGVLSGRGLLPLSMRDWIMMGIGAALVLFAVFLGYLMAVLFGA